MCIKKVLSMLPIGLCSLLAASDGACKQRTRLFPLLLQQGIVRTDGKLVYNVYNPVKKTLSLIIQDGETPIVDRIPLYKILEEDCKKYDKLPAGKPFSCVDLKGLVQIGSHLLALLVVSANKYSHAIALMKYRWLNESEYGVSYELTGEFLGKIRDVALAHDTNNNLVISFFLQQARQIFKMRYSLPIDFSVCHNSCEPTVIQHVATYYKN